MNLRIYCFEKNQHITYQTYTLIEKVRKMKLRTIHKRRLRLRVSLNNERKQNLKNNFEPSFNQEIKRKHKRKNKLGLALKRSKRTMITTNKIHSMMNFNSSDHFMKLMMDLNVGFLLLQRKRHCSKSLKSVSATKNSVRIYLNGEDMCSMIIIT